MLLLDEIANANRYKVQQGPHGPKGDEYPCVICGRGCDMDAPGTVLVNLGEGGGAIVTPEEAARFPEGDLGVYPIGSACAKRIGDEQLAPYRIRT